MRKLYVTLLALLMALAAQSTVWNGKWIQASDCNNAVNTWQVFRKVTVLDAVPTSVEAKISVDTKYWLWINGQQVIFEGGLKRGPSPTDSYYDVIEIAPYLKVGYNTIALLTQFFGKDGFSHKNSGCAALLFDAEGDDVQIVSDETWEAQVYAAYQTSTTDEPNYRLPESAVRFDGRLDIGTWYAEEYDQHFPNAVVYSEEPVNTTFGQLVRRPIPQWKDSGLQEYASKTWNASTRTMTCLLPYNAQVTPYIKLRYSGSATTPIVDIRTDYFQTDDGEKSVHIEYIPHFGEQEYEGLSWINGTQVIYKVPEDCEILEVKYRETGYDTELSGEFTCDVAFWNELFNRSSRSMYVCMRDTYFDCPNRERAQWIGDVANEIQTASYSLSPSAYKMIDKCIYEVFGWQRADGTIFGPVPAGSWDKELPVQMLMFCGWYGIYQQYFLNDDETFITDIYDGMHRYLHEVWQPGEDGFVAVREGGWSWGDWGDHIDLELLTNCWWYLAMKAENAFAQMLGKADDVALTEELMSKMHTNFDSRFWSGNDCRSQGYTIEADDRSNALAVLAGLVTPDKYDKVIAVLKQRAYASPMTELYVQRALFEMGEGKFALARARDRYEPMMTDPKESTLYEVWTGGSHNHAWSAGMNVILGGYVCGIQATSPGYKTFDVRPNFAGLRNVSFKMETPQGFINFQGMEDSGRMSIDVDVPEGTTAHVVLNGVDEYVGSGQHHFESEESEQQEESPALGDALILSADQLSSNCTWDQQGSLANLLDGRSQTYWHSIPWTMDLTKDDEYIQINLNRTDISRFIIQMNRRNDIDDGGNINHGETPTYMEIKATNDPDGEWTSIRYLSGFPYKNDFEAWPWTSNTINMKDCYQYIRLYCRQATNTYWTFSELQLFESLSADDDESADIPVTEPSTGVLYRIGLYGQDLYLTHNEGIDNAQFQPLDITRIDQLWFFEAGSEGYRLRNCKTNDYLTQNPWDTWKSYMVSQVPSNVERAEYTFQQTGANNGTLYMKSNAVSEYGKYVGGVSWGDVAVITGDISTDFVQLTITGVSSLGNYLLKEHDTGKYLKCGSGILSLSADKEQIGLSWTFEPASNNGYFLIKNNDDGCYITRSASQWWAATTTTTPLSDGLRAEFALIEHDKQYILHNHEVEDMACHFGTDSGQTGLYVTCQASSGDHFLWEIIPETYTRAKSTTGWGTICLPKMAVPDANTSLYAVAGKSADGAHILLDECTPLLQPGKPYIYFNDTADAVFTLGGCSVDVPQVGDNQLTGTFDAISGSELIGNDNIYILNSGKWYRVDNFDEFTFGANRAYIADFSSLPTLSNLEAKRMEVVDHSNTAVKSLDILDTTPIYYNLAGQRVVMPQRGIVITAGKKIMVSK